MKAQFTIMEVSALPNGKIAVSGVAIGHRMSSGEHGHTSTQLGELEVEVISVGLVDPPPTNPNVQLLQIKVLKGNPDWLKGTKVNFE